VTFQEVGDSFFAGVIAQFEQFTLDFAVASIDILTCKPHDQAFDDTPFSTEPQTNLHSEKRPTTSNFRRTIHKVKRLAS
jgi:hypothetical protein